jgi:hypothetical protein
MEDDYHRPLKSRLVTGDESWFHYHTSGKKRQSMQQKFDKSPWPKKFQTAPSAGKQIATVFWDMEDILMVEWLPQRTTVNSVIYCSILISLSENPSDSLTTMICRMVSMSWCVLS